jgi:acetyltransferase-like isoleucine patch superfamily enzyme
MKDFIAPFEINVLGYSGAYLSLVFETLSSLNYKGIVNIYPNDNKRRNPYPFETNINYNVLDIQTIKTKPKSNFVFCSNKPSTKQFLFKFFETEWEIQFDQFISVYHASSVLASTVNPNYGFYMEPCSVVSPYTKIGFGVTINRNCSIGHHNILHNFCSIHPGANLTGFVEVGTAATIGPGCTVFSSVKIGNNTIIGGGSVVTKDIPDNVLAIGNPCKIIKGIEYESDN